MNNILENGGEYMFIEKRINGIVINFFYMESYSGEFRHEFSNMATSDYMDGKLIDLPVRIQEGLKWYMSDDTEHVSEKLEEFKNMSDVLVDKATSAFDIYKLIRNKAREKYTGDIVYGFLY